MALTLPLLACDPDAALRQITPPRHDVLARAFLAELRDGRWDSASRQLSPATAGIPGLVDSLAATARALPPGLVDTLRLFDTERLLIAGVNRSALTYELHTPAGWGLIRIVVAEESGLAYVESVRSQRMQASLSSINAFSNGTRHIGSLLVLALAVLAAGFSIVTAVRVARTRMPRRWLWAVLSLVGVGQLALNWTDGAITLHLLRVSLLSAGVIRSGLAGPWVLTLSLPVGALIALRQRHRAVAGRERGNEITEPLSPAV